MRGISSDHRYLIILVVVFALVMIVATGGSISGSGGLPYYGAWYRPPDNSWHLSYFTSKDNRRVSLDHDIYYYGIGSSIQNAKKADILILGHSLVLFGLDWKVAERFSRDTGLTLFNMAFASEPKSLFSRDIIMKYNLRPKVLLVHLFLFYPRHGEYFLSIESPQYSDHARNAKSSNLLKSLKTVLAANVQFRLDNYLSCFKSFVPYKAFLEKPFSLAYRSSKTGFWYNDNSALGKFWPERLTLHQEDVQTSPCPAKCDEIALAKDFVREMSDRGTKVVFFLVPCRCLQSTTQIASAVGVPSIMPILDGLSFYDGVGGHLSEQGAIRYSKHFFDELKRIPLIRDMSSTRGRAGH